MVYGYKYFNFRLGNVNRVEYIRPQLFNLAKEKKMQTVWEILESFIHVNIVHILGNINSEIRRLYCATQWKQNEMHHRERGKLLKLLKYTFQKKSQKNQKITKVIGAARHPAKFMRECKNSWHINHLLIRQRDIYKCHKNRPHP